MKTLAVFAVLSLALLLKPNTTSAQDVTTGQPIYNPPVIVEGLFGNRGMNYQMIVNKKLQSVPKLGFFSVVNILAPWEKEEIKDFMAQGNLTYRLFKGLDLSSGFIYTPFQGAMPSAGLMYSYANPSALLVVNPRFDLANDGSFETMVLAEYKPVIKEQWRFYSRLQGLYALTYDEQKHSRSYLMLRAGLTYKDFTFGAGANLDQYGPFKEYKYNIGGFVSVPL